MIIYRLALKNFCGASGEGAKRFGGRWNLPGYPALYGSATISSALLERLTIDPELLSAHRYTLYAVMEMNCPDSLIFAPSVQALPDGWDSIPASGASQQFGTNLIRKGVLCFSIPSVVDTTSMNYVLNPQSGDFEKVKMKIYSLTLDRRIVR